jgi:hypothetical protein
VKVFEPHPDPTRNLRLAGTTRWNRTTRLIAFGNDSPNSAPVKKAVPARLDLRTSGVGRRDRPVSIGSCDEDGLAAGRNAFRRRDPRALRVRWLSASQRRGGCQRTASKPEDRSERCRCGEALHGDSLLSSRWHGVGSPDYETCRNAVWHATGGRR